VKERPILMSGPMVRAILEGRKSQTRRECKPEWYRCLDMEEPDARAAALTRCPYGQPGDRLWVRETWGKDPDGRPCYRADCTVHLDSDNYADQLEHDRLVGARWARWRPSIFMPRWACRLVLEIVAVRVERLQEISEADVRAEGCEIRAMWMFGADTKEKRNAIARPVYQNLWDSLNAKRAPWSSNPWVWVVEFRRAG